MGFSDASARAQLHPLIISAAQAGGLPAWAECAPGRRKHTHRVADLMDTWAAALALGEDDRQRWRAAAILHDALRDAEPASLVGWTDLDWPPGLQHGPACATRLRADGVEDAEILEAITFHTVGNPRLAEISDYLYMADFLEPGRRFLAEERASLRARLPEERDAVLREVAAIRIGERLKKGERLLPQSVEFWNRLVEQ